MVTTNQKPIKDILEVKIKELKHNTKENHKAQGKRPREEERNREKL